MFFISFSFLGLILIAVIANLLPAMQNGVYSRKPLVGTTFTIVCILGIIAAVTPSKCSEMVHFKRRGQKESGIKESANQQKEILTFRGHHPDCKSFGAHTFRMGNRTFCAGCVGLALGAILSLFGSAMYFFLNLSLMSDYFVALWVGFLGVSCGLLQYHLFNWGKSSIHLSINIFFVFSVFLLLMGVDGITQSVMVDSYLIALSLFWIYTRILLSQFDHRRICAACQIEECKFRWRKNVAVGLSASHSVEGATDNQYADDDYHQGA